MQLQESHNTNMNWPARDSVWATYFELFCKTAYNFYCPLKAYGQEHLPKSHFMIVSNHSSHLDSTILMVGAGLRFNETGLIAAKDYFFDQGHRFYLHYMMNLVPITRGKGVSSIRDSMLSCKSFFSNGGQALIMFPEGTRAQNGSMAKFKEGAAMLALELGIPIVPAFIYGASKSLPKGSYFLRPNKLSVYFGEPLEISDYMNKEIEDEKKRYIEAVKNATLTIYNKVKDLEQIAITKQIRINET